MTTCLIVEDNPLNWRILESQAQRLGLKVTVCTNGLEAVAHCEKYPLPQLVLLDGTMPEMDGVAFLRHMRGLPGGHEPYVVFCSSSFDREEVGMALNAGAECHFPKPISRDQIVYAIKQVHNRKRHRHFDS